MGTRSIAAQLEAMFNLLPGAYLLLSPQLRVELVSAGYQAALAAGWPCLPVGVDVPALVATLPAGQCLAHKLRASLAQVLLSQPLRNATGVVCRVLCQLSQAPVPAAAAAPGGPAAGAPLKSGQDILLAIVVQLPVAVCLLRGPRHLVEVCNPLATQVWNLPAAGCLGRPFADFFPRQVGAAYAAACAEVQRSGQPVLWPGLPVAGPLETGGTDEPTYFNLSFQLLRLPGSEPDGILLVAQNVTPLLQARRQVQLLQTELTATTTGLADYVAELLRAAAGGG